MTQEVSAGLDVHDIKPDPDGKFRTAVVYRVDGTENVDGNELLKFEMHRAGVITNTDLLTVDQHGIFCWTRINLDGELVKFNPPQPMIAMPLKRGATWNFDGQAGGRSIAGQRKHAKISPVPYPQRANIAQPDDNRALVRDRHWNSERRHNNARYKWQFA